MRFDYGYFEEKKLGKPYDLRLLRRLVPFARPYGRLFAAAIVLVVLITVLDLALPYVTKIAIDRYIVPPVASGGPDAKREKVRTYRVDLSRPQAAQVVEKHPDLFAVEDGRATIRFESLSTLTAKELKALRSRDYSGIAFAAGVLLAMVVANFVLNFLQVMILEYGGQQILHDLRMALFSHIQDLSISFFNRNPVGRLVTRITNDVQNMHELFTSVVVFVFKDLFLLVGIAVVLLGLDVKLALITFTVLPFVMVASFKFSSMARSVFRILRIRLAEINTRFSETIGGIAVIQLFGQQGENYRRFEKLNHDNFLAGMEQIRIFAVFMPVIEVLGAAAVAVVIYAGGRGVLAESVTLGSLVAFISYMRMFFRPIRDIAEKYNVMQNAMASAERIFLLLDTDERLPEPVPDTTPGDFQIGRIDVEEVGFAYVEGEPVLTDVSFSVDAGETVAVVGPTGSGKTTMMHLLARFYDPHQGKIRVGRRDFSKISVRRYRSRIALVTQDPFLFSASIRENIALSGNELPPGRLDEIVSAAQCRRLVDQLPDGLDTILAEGGGSISSGERQLLSIARAFARDPELILLDEATSYIDSETEQRVQAALANLMRGRTAVVIAHRLSTARTADRILVMHKGRIIESGGHQALMARRGFYYRLHQVQG
ncbi:MAG: ABC transporter ATP-binding protein/permease [Desulfobacterales bacterium]|nr:ABC transporter ATP-binding protein/permease [Desulfobacterales bacterium]